MCAYPGEQAPGGEVKAKMKTLGNKIPGVFCLSEINVSEINLSQMLVNNTICEQYSTYSDREKSHADTTIKNCDSEKGSFK